MEGVDVEYNIEKLMEHLVNENLRLQAQMNMLMEMMKVFFKSRKWSDEDIETTMGILYNKELVKATETHLYLLVDFKDEIRKRLSISFKLRKA